MKVSENIVEKEKLPVTIIFSLSDTHGFSSMKKISALLDLPSAICLQFVLLTLSQTISGFYVSAVLSLLKTLWKKEKLLVTSNFSFSHSVFYPFGKLSVIFTLFEIVVCRLFSVWNSLKFVVCERVKKSCRLEKS